MEPCSFDKESISEQSKSEYNNKPENANSHYALTFNTTTPYDQDTKTISKLTTVSATNSKPKKRDWNVKTPLEKETIGKKTHPGSSFGVGKQPSSIGIGPVEAKCGDEESEQESSSPSLNHMVKDIRQASNTDRLAQIDKFSNQSSSKPVSLTGPNISITRENSRKQTNNTWKNQKTNNTISLSLNQINNNFNANQHQEDNSDSNKYSFHHIDEMNQSFELGEPQLQNIMKNNNSFASKQHINSQFAKEEDTEKFYTQGFLNLANNPSVSNINGTIGTNSIVKKRSSAIFVTTVGDKHAFNDLRKLSSAFTNSQPLLDIKNQNNMNFILNQYDSLSPSRQANDLGSNVGFTNDVNSPSMIKRKLSRQQEELAYQQHQLGQVSGNFLTLKQSSVNNPGNLLQAGSGYQGELTYVEKSYGDMSLSQQKYQGGLNRIWAKNGFLILTFIKKFIINVKELSMKYKFSKMKKRYFELIDDKSNYYRYYKMNGFLKNDKASGIENAIQKYVSIFNRNFVYLEKGVTNKFQICLSKSLTAQFAVILPDSFIKIFWDVCIFLLLTINVFYIPVKISFDELDGISGFYLVFFEDLPSWAFVADIVLNFNTAYYSKGVINKTRMKIAKHYIKTNFAWDLVIVIPFLLSSLLAVKYLNIILLLRSSKILKIVVSIEELLNLKQNQATMMQLFKLIVTIIYIAHICGCFFYYMHSIQIQSDPSITTWVVKFHINNEGWVQAYVSSFYWSVITMITLGYGDLYPITMVEKIYVCIVTLLSCGVFAYAVNSIGVIIQQMTQRGDQFRSQMSSLTNHMRSRDLSNVMQMRVRKYFEYLHYEKLEDNEDGQKVLGQCTSSLKNEVLTEMYSKVLQSRKEFRLNFSKEFLGRLAPKLRERRLGPEEILFRENEYSRKVYFLMRGNIALQRRRSTGEEKQKDINIKILKKGDIVGLESFLSGSQTVVSAKTLNVVSLVYLREEDFLSEIVDFPKDKEQYAMMKDKLNLQNTYRGLGLNCYLCDSYMHQFLNCPYMSYQPNSKKVIKKALQDHVQERAEFTHVRQHQTKTISYVLPIQETVIRYLLENNPFATLAELIEKIKIIDESDGLQIDTPDILAKYIRDPQEFDDLDDLPDEQDIDEYLRSPKNDAQSINANLNNNTQFAAHEDSVHLRRTTIGSNYSANGRVQQVLDSNNFNRRGSLRVRKNSPQISPLEANNNNLLDPPKRGEERKSSFRKQTMFSDHDQVYFIKGGNETSPLRRKRTSSLDTQSLRQSENVIMTPVMTHNLPNTPQLGRNKDRVGRFHSKQMQSRSIKEDEESNRDRANTQGFNSNRYENNSQPSINYLDNLPTTSIKSNQRQGESNRLILIDSKHDADQGRVASHNYNMQNGSQREQIKEFMILLNFDKEKSWEVFFPQHNLVQVLDHYQRILDRILNAQRKKKKRQNHRTHSQKVQQMQQIFQTMQARNQSKNNTHKYSRNNKSKASFVSRRDSSINPIQPGQSQMLLVGDKEIQRELSHSIFSAAGENSEIPPLSANARSMNESKSNIVKE